MWWRSGYISCVVKFLPGFQIRGKPMTQGDMVPPCTTLPQLATVRYLVPDPIWKIQGGPEKVAFWMFCIWYGGGFRGDHFRSQKLYCRLNWRQWFRRKQILEFTVYLQVRMEIGWTTHNFENCRLPRMRSIGPSLSTLLKCTMTACNTCGKQHDCILDAQYILCHKTLCLKCTPSPSSTEPAHYVESSKCSTHTACTQMCDV